MNVVCITGRLIKDPELRTTPSGVSVTTFGLAVDRPGVKDKADFIDCVAWGSSAEFVSKYFTKGDGIEVNGVLTSRSYEDKNGNKRKVVEVIADRVGFMKHKPKSGSSETSGEDYLGPGMDFAELDDDGDPPF